MTQYRLRLYEKQKLRFHYGLTERQLLTYVRDASKAKGSTGQVLIKFLEMRLDNLVFRVGLAPTIPGARQLVNHKHILVNGRTIDRPSYHCEPTDILTLGRGTINNLNSADQEREDETPPKHPSSPPDSTSTAGVFRTTGSEWRRDLDVNELLVVEYYSRKA